ncbi:MAG: protein adenylyltransferase SelO, partial [Planctomycetaceae bacterium]
QRFPQPQLVVLNQPIASELGLDFSRLSPADTARLISGQVIPSDADPIAQAYAGHQYGGFTMLGDGRAILLGEQLTPRGGRVDLQFKGSGPTPYSRRGDGRAALGPMLREYIISEAMHALGIPSTRSLAVVATGDTIVRDTRLPGAVLTRVAASHLRVGTFQFPAARNDQPVVLALTDYTLARHFQDIEPGPDRYLALLDAVCERQARLIAQWQLVGFVHGVMNTDNMALAGETIDYGPCAFLDTYHPEMVFSSIDHGGRYAYGNQPAIAQWNLARFAETLLPLLHAEQPRAIELATERLHQFAHSQAEHWLAGMRLKLGLATARDDDQPLCDAFFDVLQGANADFTNTFLELEEVLAGGEPGENLRDPAFTPWIDRWQARRGAEGIPVDRSLVLMRGANPRVIPRNHRVEAALTAATESADLRPFHQLLQAVSRPFELDAALREYRQPPPPGSCRHRTFCGT